MRLAEARFPDGRSRLVAPLPSAPARLVDLHAVEVIRLAKLGEGMPEALAQALVPSSLEVLLMQGPRALVRVRQTLAYAEKWERRSGLPEPLTCGEAEVLPAAPTRLCTFEGRVMADALLGARQALPGTPSATLTLVGQQARQAAGVRLTLVGEGRLLLSPWLETEAQGALQLVVGGHRRKVNPEVWEGVNLPILAPGEHRLLPPPRLRPWASLPKGAAIELTWGDDHLQAQLARALDHPTLQ